MTDKTNPVHQGHIQPPARNLTQRMCDIMRDAKAIGKSGTNTQQNYAFVKESDVAEQVRELCAKHGVGVFSTDLMVEFSEREVVSNYQGKETVKVITSATVKRQYTLVNADNPSDFREVIAHGRQDDYSDKALNKAYTSCAKYFYKNQFLLTFDEAEGDHDHVEGGRRTQAPQTPPARAAAPAQARPAQTPPTRPAAPPAQAAAAGATSGTKKPLTERQLAAIQQSYPNDYVYGPVWGSPDAEYIKQRGARYLAVKEGGTGLWHSGAPIEGAEGVLVWQPNLGDMTSFEDDQIPSDWNGMENTQPADQNPV